MNELPKGRENFRPIKAKNFTSYLRYKNENRCRQLPRIAPKEKKDAFQIYSDMGIGFQKKHGERYYSIILPDGWMIVDTKEHGWRELLDSKKSVRARINYCDENNKKYAHVYFRTRFYVSEIYDKFDINTCKVSKRYCIKDNKNGSVIFSTESTNKIDDCTLKNLCVDFLNKEYPKYSDPTYYWD